VRRRSRSSSRRDTRSSRAHRRRVPPGTGHHRFLLVRRGGKADRRQRSRARSGNGGRSGASGSVSCGAGAAARYEAGGGIQAGRQWRSSVGDGCQLVEEWWMCLGLRKGRSRKAGAGGIGIGCLRSLNAVACSRMLLKAAAAVDTYSVLPPEPHHFTAWASISTISLPHAPRYSIPLPFLSLTL
jgi:hypothetical protein